MLNELLSLRAKSDFLGAFDESKLRDFARELDEVRCEANQALIRAGDPGNRLYVVLSGRLEILIGREGDDEQAVGEIGPGDVTGEVSLFIGGKRTATVRALTACRLACLSRDGFASLLAKHPETSRRVSVLVLKRLRLSHLAPHLTRTFGPLDLETLRELEAEIEWLTLRSGQDLFHQGDPADAAYIVASGRLRAAVDSEDGGEQVLDEMGPGELVGEMALLTDGPRAATVYAVRDASLARLPSPGFARLIERHPRAMLPISRTIVDRLVRQSSPDSRPKAAAHTIALVPTDPGVPLEAFARHLVRSLASHGSVVLLTSTVVDEALAKAGIAQISHGAHHIRLSRWLNEQEATFRFVVYQAQSRWTPWTDCCVRHADHLLIVAAANSDPTPGETEERLASRWPRARAPRRSLVLLHPGTEPTATSEWLRVREIDQHFHLRPDTGTDFARLARSLTGKAVGLVLGGGGARGFAHIGVLKALEELGIPIDLVGGTSMGAIIAGLCAQRLSSAEIRRRCAKYAGAQLDFTFPAVALLAGRKISRQFHALFGERMIEDLWIPFHAVSTNLTRAEQMVHTRGPLLAAIRASMSLPGILPPAQQGGDLLVDGGLINNVPVDVMREEGGGTVIAVDVSQKVDLSGDPRLTTELSGWKVLRSRLNPLAEAIPAPGILTVLSRVTEISSRAALKRTQGLADLYLQLPLGDWKLLEFEAIEAIASHGYNLTIEPLRVWRDSGTRET